MFYWLLGNTPSSPWALDLYFIHVKNTFTYLLFIGEYKFCVQFIKYYIADSQTLNILTNYSDSWDLDSGTMGLYF